jgi:hypothetical protein
VLPRRARNCSSGSGETHSCRMTTNLGGRDLNFAPNRRFRHQFVQAPCLMVNQQVELGLVLASPPPP